MIDIVLSITVQCGGPVKKKIEVYSSKKLEKQIKRLPKQIRRNLKTWIDNVLFEGVTKVRKLRGYNDESLQGKRFGQRSVRLNRGYRLIYYY